MSPNNRLESPGQAPPPAFNNASRPRPSNGLPPSQSFFQGQPTPPQFPDMPLPPNQSKRRLKLAVVLIVAVVLIGGVTILVTTIGKKNTKNAAGNGSSNNTNQPSTFAAADLSAIASFSFMPPQKTTGYTDSSDSSGLTSYTNGDSSCVLSFGSTANATGGQNAEDILAIIASNAGQQGATDVTSPQAIAPLIMKDAADSRRTYKLDSYSITYIAAAETNIDHLSAFTTSDGRVTQINRTCHNADSTQAAAAIKSLDAMAGNITINAMRVE